jgi:RNA polymerase sigma-70 factor (sigma-E family)
VASSITDAHDRMTDAQWPLAGALLARARPEGPGRGRCSRVWPLTRPGQLHPGDQGRYSARMKAREATISISRGQPRTFEEFFTDSYEPLLRAVYLVTGDRFEAEDLAQEAFFRVYQRWERVSRMANPEGYAYRIAINAYHGRLRRLATAARRAFRREAPDELGAAEERDSIRRALARLPRGQREALVLMDWVGLSDRQAAEILGMDPAAVRVRLSRARRRLREERRGEDRE